MPVLALGAASVVHVRGPMNQPDKKPPSHPPREEPKPKNPDPKAHPMHIQEPIEPEQGADPKQPVKIEP